MFKKYLLVIGLLFCFAASRAQDYNEIVFRIDSLANMGLPKSALPEVDKLDALARKNNNAPQQVRAAVYRMTFQSYLEENALTAIISRLKTDITRADYPVKPVLQSLLAQMYWNYYQQSRYQISQRTRLLKPDTDFTRWDLQAVINETSRLYETSLKDAAKEQLTPVGVLDGVLEGDSTTRYLRPTLYDLLVQRALDFFLTDEASLTRPRLPFSLNDPRFFSDNRTFAGLQIQTTDTASTVYKGIKYLQQATLFHLKKLNEEALADLDLQRLRFLYGKSTVDRKDSLYLSALKQVASRFSARPISSEALVLQGQYYQGIDSLTIAYGLFKKAMDAYPKSLGGKNAAILIKQLEEKDISATVENVNVPDKPILALLSYRNLSAAKMEIFRLSESQLKEYTDEENKRQFLKDLDPVQTKTITWPIINDLLSHRFEFKIDPLARGIYVLLLRDTTEINDSPSCLAVFEVSNLAYIARSNPDGFIELRTLNRETGKPLQGVRLDLTGKEENYDRKTPTRAFTKVEVKGVSDKNGLFRSDELPQEINVNLVLNDDTLNAGVNYLYKQADGADDKPSNKTVFFTDRQVYRPGQTIYFKMVQLQTFKGKSTVIANKVIDVELMDINYKQLSKLSLETNGFGSVGGSFTIPETELNGVMNIKTDDGNTTVRVEEYKRPSFQVEFLPVKDTYKLNDSVTVNGMVTSFSGYGLSQARIAYRVVRNQKWLTRRINPTLRSSYGPIPEAEIKSDTVTADNQGHFKIKFPATPPQLSNTGKVNYVFQVIADVTDESGETHSGETKIIVGNDDIRIDSQLPEQLFANDSVTAQMNLINLNGQRQKGKIKVEVYSLESPGELFKNRLWNEPDQYFISRDDFKADFPGYAYRNEGAVANWPKLSKVIETNIDADTAKQAMINFSALAKHAPGIYEIEISAKNEKGDTTSLTRYISVIAASANPSKFNDWVLPCLNVVKAGDTASFLIGTGKPVNVLIERYNGIKLMFSKWVTIDKGLQTAKFAVSDTDRNAAVQFMMVYQNRVYTSYQSIFVESPKSKIQIKSITFHNKLQPGQKEQWKVQLSGPDNSKLTAEMVADLYDESLDKIFLPDHWNEILDIGSHFITDFQWQSQEFIGACESYPVTERQNNYPILYCNYENLNLFGYNYYGGYNFVYHDYLTNIQDASKTAKHKPNRKGYVNGVVTASDDGLSLLGVSVKVKGTNTSVHTGTNGRFTIKVPARATLEVSFIGYKTREITLTDVANLKIVMIPASQQLSEVVVTGALGIQRRPVAMGYSTQSKMDIYGSIATVGVSDAKTISTKNSEQLLQGQVAGVKMYDGLYDSALRQEVSSLEARSPIALRKNFNETAFFYPQLHTDDKGEIAIDFTIPEALTRWRFRGFAHTQNLKTGYIEAEVVTQKQLSISANTPRFLREGDTITISARLANLTSGKLNGKVKMQLFNALNMQPVSLFVNAADASQDFDVAANTNKAVSFKLVMPSGLDALDYKLTADAGTFSDGEENTLPVLPNRTLVTESMPMMVRPGQTRDFTFDKLVNQHSATLKNKTLTLEFTPNPAWYAVQALPYMMEFPYECSEQVFSRYFANSLAVNIVNKMPAIKKVFEQWKSANSTELLSNLEKNEDLKSTLIEETPWLRDAENETEQKKRITLLFDLNKMGDELKLNLDKLQKRQLPGGGFTWFGGDYPDRYITQHIAEGIGELYHIGIGKDNAELQQIAGGALTYLDGQIIADEKQRLKNPPNQRYYNDMDIYSWYARSFYLDKSLDKDLQTAEQAYFQWAVDAWKFRNVYEQGLIALTMQRYGKSDITKQIERSLLQTAQQSDDMGMYWAKNQLGYYWYESPVETQSLLIDMFTEAGDNTKAVDEMKIWLLRNKQTSDWKTTRATAAACYALLLKGSYLLADSCSTSIKLGGKELTELKPDIKADTGTGYIKTSWMDEQIKPAYGKVEIANHGTTIGWGALHWKYLENLDKITTAQTNIHLQRKYFIQKQGDAGALLTEVDATHQPKTGDLLKVVVYLKADRDFEYVQLKDMRPAGTEPVDALSTYKYQDGLYYYQVTKDVATNFFISQMNKGSYVFEYALRVAQPGNFSTGITTMQCMYAPEFNAHSDGGRMAVKP